MLVTLGLFILFFAFAVALALFWWFLTYVLPLLILLYLIRAAIRFALAVKCGSEGANARE